MISYGERSILNTGLQRWGIILEISIGNSRVQLPLRRDERNPKEQKLWCAKYEGHIQAHASIFYPQSVSEFNVVTYDEYIFCEIFQNVCINESDCSIREMIQRVF